MILQVYFHATWMDTENLCIERQSHLASIHSAAENAFITCLYDVFSNYCIFFSDSYRPSATELGWDDLDWLVLATSR